MAFAEIFCSPLNTTIVHFIYKGHHVTLVKKKKTSMALTMQTDTSVYVHV